MKINSEQRLYVLPEGKGYSCLGFDVCETRTKRLAEWLKVPMPSNPVGTPEAYAAYLTLMDMARIKCAHEHIRCEVELTPQLIGLEGKRVEVVTSYGERERFYVGKSTGWMPIHLQIARRNSSGGPGVVGAPFKEIRVIGTR